MEKTTNNLANVNGVQLYVERHGCGEPLLMIPGLGAGTWLWVKSVHALSQHFELTMPELRGSGRSDKPDKRYSVALFAADLQEMLTQLEIKKVHIIGASLGGFVAQYLAARWPGQVAALVLVATSLGGEQQIGPTGEVLCHTIRPRGKTKQERLEDAYFFQFTEEFRERHPDELGRITAWREQFPQPEFAYYRQLLAGNAYDGAQLAANITAPTLICAARHDPFVPLEDTYALKNKIAHSELVLFEGRHLFFFEQSRKFNQVVLDFLQRHPIASDTRKALSYQTT